MSFDVKIIKHVIKLRKRDKDALAEEEYASGEPASIQSLSN